MSTATMERLLPSGADERIAAEWGLTLRPVETQAGSVIGIYSGRLKLADYCEYMSELVVGAERRNVSTLFDAITAVARLAAIGSKAMPSWLRP